MHKHNESPKYNIAELFEKLFVSFPQFRTTIEYSYDDKGKIGRVVYINPNQPSFPLNITIYDYDGIYVDFTRVTIIEFESDVTEELIQQIELLINDEIEVMAGYNNAGRIFFCATFIFDGEKKSDGKHERFKAKLLKPIPKWKRPFAFYKGTFVFNNWSGSKYLRIER